MRLTQKPDAPAGHSRPRRSFEPRSILPPSVPTSFAIFSGDPARQCLRRERDHRRIALEDEGEEGQVERRVITGAPTLSSGILYVQVSSEEEATGRPARLSMLHLSRQCRRAGYCDGQADLEGLHHPRGPASDQRNAVGTQLHGPSGAAVWSAPTVDVQRQVLYVATGDESSDPPSETSDAILAFDLATGRMLWHRQVTANDSYITSCISWW